MSTPALWVFLYLSTDWLEFSTKEYGIPDFLLPFILRICKMVNFKNLFAGLVGTFAVASLVAGALPVSAQLNDPEFTDAFEFLMMNEYTNATTESNYRPLDFMTRGEFTKPASKLAAEELCLERDMTIACSFSDTTGYDSSLVPFITAACQMELVKGSNGMYFPVNSISKAEVLTIVSRALSAANGEDAPSENVTPRWANHHRAMLAAGITNETNVDGLDRPVTRYEVGLMMYRLANATTLTCDEELDLTDLLNDLFGDDEEEMNDDNMEDTGDDAGTPDTDGGADETPTVSDGMVMAMLSPSTPAGDTVPGLASVEVAAFDFTANGDDVELETIVLERFGLGSEDVVDELTLLVNGEVVTKSRDFNSDDEVTFSMNPEVMIEAGETVTVVVLAEIGDADDVSNEEFSVGLTDFETNGDEDTSNLPIIANEFEVAGTNAAVVIVTEDGNLSDVELGEDGAEIASFTLDNDSDDAVYITTIVLEDDENEIEDSFENFILEHNGDEVAMVANVSDKYLTFTLATPVMIDENEEEDFKVLADVIAGAGEQVNLIIDESIYIRGYDERYGFGLAVDVDAPNWYRPEAIDINAGELTFVEIDIDRDEIRADREDIVIAAFDVNVNAGQDLSLEDIKFTVTAANWSNFDDDSNTSTPSLLAHFDEVELIVTTDGSRRTYDLDTTSTMNGDAFTAEDDDLGIFLPEGSDVMIALEVETINNFPLTSIWEDFSVFLDVANDVEIIENDDDEEVNDIVPSSITFDTLEFVSSEVEVNSINLTDVDVVKGAKNVDVVKFEIETDDVSWVFFEGVTLEGEIDMDYDGNFAGFTDEGSVNQDYITAIRLWMRTSAGYELLEAEGGFDIENGVVTLDDFDEVFVPVASTQEFLVTVDVADSDTITDDSFRFRVTATDIEDDDNVQLPSATADSTRSVAISDSWELNVSVETGEEEVDDSVFVLGGSDADEAPFVAAFEFTAENESVEIEDLTLTATVGAGDFDQAVAEVVLFDEDGNVIDSETVSSNVVEFNNIDLVIEEGSQFVFVKVVTDIIGDNENGAVVSDVTFALSLDNVDGVDSGDEVSGLNLEYEGVDSTVASSTNSSLEFSVVPVKFSNAEFVTSAASTSVDTSTTNGNDVNLAILNLTADSWDNTDRGDGSDLEAVVKTLRFETSNTTDVSNYEIRRIGNGSTDYISGTLVGNVVEFNLWTDTNTVEFESGENGYYLIRGDINAAAGTNTTIRLTLDNLNGGAAAGAESIVYAPSDFLAEEYTELRIGDEFVESQNVTVNNN